MVQQKAPKNNTIQRENVPDYLTLRGQWVMWKYEDRGKGRTKVPYDPRTGRRASTTDLMTWGTFEKVLEALEGPGDYDGIGFVFCSADPFVGIDLDDCRDPKTGEIQEWAREIIDGFEDKYVEASPSGRGVHIITRGVLKDGRKCGPIEAYGQDRFFTITGVAI